MAGLETIERQLKLATRDLEPAEINRRLAGFARSELAKALAAGEASEPYDVYVNGVRGAREETVQAPGPILYVFSNWPLVINAALNELRRRSPHRTGRYAASFIVLADGRPVTSFGAIGAGAEVIVFNSRPFTRKIEVGGNRTGRRHIDASRAALARRFGEAFRFETRYLSIGPGIDPEVPYLLRRGGRRKGRRAGQAISYPAIVINAG